MNEVLAEFIVCCAVCSLMIACWFDVYVSVKAKREIKKLDKRVTALEEGRVSDVNN